SSKRFRADSCPVLLVPPSRFFPSPPAAAGSKSFLVAVAGPPGPHRPRFDADAASGRRWRPADPTPTASLSWSLATAAPTRSLRVSSRASSGCSASGPAALILAFFQCQIFYTQVRHKQLQPLILLPQILYVVAGGFPLGIAAQPPLSRFHEILQPLVVNRRMDPLTSAQIGYRHLSANPFHHDADLLLGGKSPATGLLGSANQLPRRLSPAPASPARGQDWPSLLTSILHLRFVLLLLLPQFLFHGSPFFLRILAPGG